MTIHSELKGDIVFTSHKIDGDVDSSKLKIDGNVEKGLGVQTQWGKITGDIENQTDLIGMFGNYVTEEEFDNVKYIFINGQECIIDALYTATLDGISWLVIHLDDGTVDGRVIYLPDSFGLATASNQIIALIPTKVSQLTNDSGYITGIDSSMVTNALGFTPYNSTNPSGYTSDSALTTADIDEVCV